MKIKNFGNDVQALARAHRSADSHLLQTPSGKLKENTLFERVVGRGKELLSKISGKSYELRKISYAEGKAEIQKRFNAQLRFFSGDSEAYTSKKDDFENKGNSFLDSVIGSDTIFSNPKKAIATQISTILSPSPDDNNTITTAFQRLGTIYDHKNSSANFISTAMEYDALRGTDENAVISEEQIAYTTKLGSVAERAHKDGAYKDHAYVIAKLALDPTIFTDSDDDNRRYNIAASAFFYAVDRGIYNFEKMKKILPLKKEEADAVGKLQNIRSDLKKIKKQDPPKDAAMKIRANLGDINPALNTNMDQLRREARNKGFSAVHARFYAALMLDKIENLPENMEERKVPVIRTLMIAEMNGIKSYRKMQEVFVLKYAEASAERELAEIREKIHAIQPGT